MLDLSTSVSRGKKGKEEMTRKQDSAKRVNWKEVMGEQEDFLKPLIQEVLQQVLEMEMEEAIGAGKSERTAARQGDRSGYYGRTLVTRVGKLELRVPQDRQGPLPDRSFRALSAQRKSAGGSADGDVCARSIDAESEGDHRRAVRA
jgi:hypothetical protein